MWQLKVQVGTKSLSLSLSVSVCLVGLLSLGKVS
jgi:hypothetical protein